ncbi:YaiI/YqxD family protein [bacterium]|nr:YaiI/YqxD family protein [bacterium]
MQLFMDADACPRVIKEIVYRAIARVKLPLIMITNQTMSVPQSPFITLINVDAGADMADDKIVELVQPGDLVITADIPLADRVVDKDAYALDPRGAFHTKETIKQRLAIRNLMDHLRNSGIPTGGPAGFNPKDRKAFADQLDKFIAKQ